MLSKSIVRIIPALALLSALGMSNVAFANNQAKLALAKKAVIAGEVSPYATPDLKKVLQQAHAIDDRIQAASGYMCEFVEHAYLGHGNAGLEAHNIRNWKPRITKSGVKVTFNNMGASGTHLVEVEFDMVCKGNSCQISDVRHGYSQSTGLSLKQEAQAMINANSCV
jgi:hypothetical protein